MDWLATFILFFAVVDPIGTIPIFIVLTAGMDEKTKSVVALKASLIATGVLVFFIFFGDAILRAIDVPIAAFQIAGGAVLFLFALQMVFGESKPSAEMQLGKDDAISRAIFPLAVPYLAGPGAMLVAVLQAEKTQHGLPEMSASALIVCAVMVVAYVGMIFSTKIFSWIGESGSHLVSRVMGLILASLAVSSVLQGIKEYFSLCVG
jgi:multiple antibiotic resistance protein